MPRPARLTSRGGRHATTVVLVLLLRFAPSAPFAQPLPEYQVKAAFLLQFTRYVEWPEKAFARPDATFLMCILGRDPFGRTLDQVAGGERAGARSITVVRLASPGGARKCHLVFVASSERNLAAVLPLLREAGVLSVGESRGFAARGGVINFYQEGNNIRFEINPTAAEASGLKISSHLLRLAKIVP